MPDYMASSLSVLSNLDASSVNIWRPIFAFIAIWTPLNSGDGVRSAQLIQSGRHPLNHMASVLHAYHVLDAMQHLDALQHLDAMLHQNSPANIPGIPQNKTGNCPAFHNSGKPAVAFISLMWKVYSPKGINLLRILFGYCLSWNLLLELLFAGFSLYQFNYFYYWDYQD